MPTEVATENSWRPQDATDERGERYERLILPCGERGEYEISMVNRRPLVFGLCRHTPDGVHHPVGEFDDEVKAMRTGWEHKRLLGWE